MSFPVVDIRGGKEGAKCPTGDITPANRFCDEKATFV